MEEIPPRIIVREARKRGARAAASDVLTPRVDATPSVVADSGEFPVLEAFQEYLNKERQRVQKRILGMAAVFGVLLIVVAAGGYILIRGWIVSLDTKVQVVAMNASADAKASHGRIDEQLRSNASAFESLQTALATEQQQRSTHQEQVEQVLSTYSNDVGALQELVSRLEAEKQSLSTQLNEMSAILPQLSQKIETLAQGGVRQPVQVIPSAVGQTGQEDLPSSGRGLVSMLILPQGHTQAIRWRQPIPE